MNIIFIVDCYKIHNSLSTKRIMTTYLSPVVCSFARTLIQQTTTVKQRKVLPSLENVMISQKINVLFCFCSFRSCFTEVAPKPMNTLLFFNVICKMRYASLFIYNLPVFNECLSILSFNSSTYHARVHRSNCKSVYKRK